MEPVNNNNSGSALCVGCTEFERLPSDTNMHAALRPAGGIVVQQGPALASQSANFLCSDCGAQWLRRGEGENLAWSVRMP
jgi:hypothetical protein